MKQTEQEDGSLFAHHEEADPSAANGESPFLINGVQIMTRQDEHSNEVDYLNVFSFGKYVGSFHVPLGRGLEIAQRLMPDGQAAE